MVQFRFKDKGAGSWDPPCKISPMLIHIKWSLLIIFTGRGVDRIPSRGSCVTRYSSMNEAVHGGYPSDISDSVVFLWPSYQNEKTRTDQKHHRVTRE